MPPVPLGDLPELLCLRRTTGRVHSYGDLSLTGTDIVDAIIRSNPSYSTETGAVAADVRIAAERINMSTVFGAMSKHRFPVQNLMAAAKYASAYSTSNDRGTVLLLPHASTDLLRSTRRENMVYSISGPELLQRNKGKPIDMQFEDSYVDPATNVRIVIHRPFPTFQSGVANPDVGPGPLTDVVSFASYYVLPKAAEQGETRIVDFNNRCWHNLGTREEIMVKGLTPTKGDTASSRTAPVAFLIEAKAAVQTVVDGKPSKKFTDDAFKKASASIEKCLTGDDEDTKLTDRLAAAKDCILYNVAKRVEEASAKLMLVQDADQSQSDKTAASAVKLTIEEGTESDFDKLNELVILRPRMNAVMSSGILAAPGAETGELLVGYPFTSVSTSSTEIVKIQLRVYLGAVMKRPENVILLRNIFFEGLREGSGTKLFENGYGGVGDNEPGAPAGDLTVIGFPKTYLKAHSKIDYADFTDEAIGRLAAEEKPAYFVTQAQLISLGMVAADGLLDASFLSEGVPTVVYQGACEHRPNSTGSWVPQQKNNGHLGILDDPALADRLFGTFAYSDAGGNL